MTTFELDFLNHLERELNDLAGRDTARRRRPRLAFLLAGATVALVALLALTLNLGDSRHPAASLHGPASAHAAIARARAALTPPKHGVFHVRIEFRQQGKRVRVNEIWQSPQGVRATNTGRPEGGVREDGTQELYDRAHNTIYAARTSHIPPSSLLAAYTSDARTLLNSGARVTGHASIDGIDCLRIQDASVKGTKHTLFVDARTYRPVLERMTEAKTRSEFRFRVWQVLAPTAAALRLADVRQMHPHARVVLGKAAYYAAEARLLHLTPGPPGQPPVPHPIVRAA